MYITVDNTVQAIHTLMRELKISYTSEILTSVSTHWYWSMIHPAEQQLKNAQKGAIRTDS